MCSCGGDAGSTYFPRLAAGAFGAATLMIDRDAAENLGYAHSDGALAHGGFAALAISNGLTPWRALGDAQHEPIVLESDSDDYSSEDDGDIQPIVLHSAVARRPRRSPPLVRPLQPVAVDDSDEDSDDNRVIAAPVPRRRNPAEAEDDSDDDDQPIQISRRQQAQPPRRPPPVVVIASTADDDDDEDTSVTEVDSEPGEPAEQPPRQPRPSRPQPKRALSMVATDGVWGITTTGKFARFSDNFWRSVRKQLPPDAVQARLRGLFDDAAEAGKRAREQRRQADREQRREAKEAVKARKKAERERQAAEKRANREAARREQHMAAKHTEEQKQIAMLVRNDDNAERMRANRRELYMRALQTAGDRGIDMLSQYKPLDRIIEPQTKGSCAGKMLWTPYRSLGGGDQGYVCMLPREKRKLYVDNAAGGDAYRRQTGIGCVAGEDENGHATLDCPAENSYTRRYIGPQRPCLECVPGTKQAYTNTDGCMVTPDGKVVRPDEPLCRVHSVAAAASRQDAAGPTLRKEAVKVFAGPLASELDPDLAREIGLDYDRLAKHARRYGPAWPVRPQKQ